jgi:hypothetical protein
MHVKKENRSMFRGLRHSLIGEPDEVAQYERELADHLEQDKRMAEALLIFLPFKNPIKWRGRRDSNSRPPA